MRRRHFLIIALAFASSAVAGRVLAQQYVSAGARVRVVDTGTHASLLKGTFVRVAADSVFVTASDSTAFMMLGGPHQLQVSGGRHGHPFKGMGIGFVAGAGLGAIIGSATYSDSDCADAFFCNKKINTGVDAIGGALLGLLVGGIVGASVKTEKWRSIDHRTVRVAVVPSRSRTLQLAVAITTR